MSEMNNKFEDYKEGFEEDFEDEEFIESDVISCGSFNNCIKECMEITFKVKKDFEHLFKAIKKTHEKLLYIDLCAVYSINEIIRCIDLQSKCVKKGPFYNTINVTFPERYQKKARKAAKKCLGELLHGSKHILLSCNFNVSMWENQIEFTEIFERNDKIYCRMEIDNLGLSNCYVLKAAGEVLGGYAEEITEVVKICDKLINSYEPLDFEMVNGCIKVHSILENDVSIKLIDKTKVYMVKANIMIPETMKNVIKQVDEIDQVIESVKPKEDKHKLQLMYDKLTYNYDMTCAYLRDNRYESNLYNCRLYEREKLFKGFSDKIKKIVVNGDDDQLIRFEYNEDDEKTVLLASSLLNAEENKFSDDYKYWIFSGTFTNIDRVCLENAFEKIKKNVQLFGVPEQYIDIRVAEIQ